MSRKRGMLLPSALIFKLPIGAMGFDMFVDPMIEEPGALLSAQGALPDTSSVVSSGGQRAEMGTGSGRRHRELHQVHHRQSFRAPSGRSSRVSSCEFSASLLLDLSLRASLPHISVRELLEAGLLRLPMPTLPAMLIATPRAVSRSSSLIVSAFFFGRSWLTPVHLTEAINGDSVRILCNRCYSATILNPRLTDRRKD